MITLQLAFGRNIMIYEGLTQRFRFAVASDVRASTLTSVKVYSTHSCFKASSLVIPGDFIV